MQQPQLMQPFVPGVAFHRNRDTAPAYWMLDLGERRAGLTASWSS
jgi:hypothetical protein